MLLSDLTFYANGPLLGCDQSLTVVTETSQVSSQWLLDWMADRDSVFVSFCRDRSKCSGDFIDLSGDLFGTLSQFSPPDLDAILSKIQDCQKTTVILQYPTLILLANLSDQAALMSFIHTLLAKHRVVVAVALTQASIESPLPISQQLTQFVQALMHQANLVLTLRPFPTGRADDITGVFRVSAGPRSLGIVEREYLYTVGKQVVLDPK